MDLIKQFTAAQDINDRVKQAYDLMLKTAQGNQNPATVASGINALTQPLSQATTRNTLNQVNAAEAAAGRTQSPGLYAYDVAQALGPQNLKQQELGQQGYFNAQGLPFSIPTHYPNASGGGLEEISSLFGGLFPGTSTTSGGVTTTSGGGLSGLFGSGGLGGAIKNAGGDVLSFLGNLF